MDNTEFSEKAKPFGRRSLTAIMFTDVVDSSRLMGDDEEQMMALLKRDLRLISDLCQQFEGRVLKSMGDGCLAIFDSGVHAVECAQEIQRYFAEQAQTLPLNEVLQHRIGLHLGDVYINEDDVMGDGVNVAARLQSEASPGGICISQALYEVVKTRLALQTVYEGPKHLKNIKEPVHLYQLTVSEGKTAPHDTQVSPQPTVTSKAPVSPVKKRPKSKKLFWGIGLLALVLVVAGLIVFQMSRKTSEESTDPYQKFSELDRNDDQQLTPDELPEQVREQIMLLDINHDGVVDIPEMDIALAQKQQREQFQEVLFHHFNNSDDEQISPDELPELFRARMMEADKNQNGVLDMPEFQKVMHQIQFHEGFRKLLFQQLDANHDQRLMPEELPDSIREDIMNVADMNHDGAVDSFELLKTLDKYWGPAERTSPQNLENQASQRTDSEQGQPTSADGIPFFSRYDKNNDKKLTEDELPRMGRNRIMRADQNQDGVITEAEFREALKQREQSR